MVVPLKLQCYEFFQTSTVHSFDFLQKSHFECLHLVLHSFGHCSRLMATGEMGMNIDLNTANFSFPDKQSFKTTEGCKTRVTAFALGYRAFNSSSYLPSLLNATLRCLNISACFNDIPPTSRKHWTGFVKRWKC